MKVQTITLDKKKYRVIEESEYQTMKQDIADLKKVFARRSESGTEANAFFAQLQKRNRK